ncbi:MAG: sulfite oxidase-like oxidoreductase [Candidatus Symbiobacter sp.]|nr:sulfite oxidase-like oxidoreductase [Candidatus Symbiobacter sp.]
MGIFDTDAKRQKLLDKKRQWAEEGRLLTGKTGIRGRDRLPPGQHEVKNWPILDLGVQPNIDRMKWKLTIDGLVENPVTWDWLEFFSQPQVTWVSDIHCVTAWSRYDNEWMGVSAAHILSVVRPLAAARYLMFHSQDSYTTNLTLKQFSDEDVLLAHSWQGELLPREHGGPVRAIVPQFYFWKSAKWIKRIEFIAEDKLGYWENRGYHNTGDPWKEERYDR